MSLKKQNSEELGEDIQELLFCPYCTSVELIDLLDMMKCPECNNKFSKKMLLEIDQEDILSEGDLAVFFDILTENNDSNPIIEASNDVGEKIQKE